MKAKWLRRDLVKFMQRLDAAPLLVFAEQPMYWDGACSGPKKRTLPIVWHVGTADGSHADIEVVRRSQLPNDMRKLVEFSIK